MKIEGDTVILSSGKQITGQFTEEFKRSLNQQELLELAEYTTTEIHLFRAKLLKYINAPSPTALQPEP